MKKVLYTHQWLKALFLRWCYFSILFYLFLPHHTSVLVPQPGMEALAPAVETQILNHWTARLKLFWRNIAIVCGQFCQLFATPWIVAVRGFFVDGILQARIPEQVAIPIQDLPDPGIKTASLGSPALIDRFFTTIIWEALMYSELSKV